MHLRALAPAFPDEEDATGEPLPTLDTRPRWWKCHRRQLKAAALNEGRAGWMPVHDAWLCVRCKDVLTGPRRKEEPGRSVSSEDPNGTEPTCPSRSTVCGGDSGISVR